MLCLITEEVSLLNVIWQTISAFNIYKGSERESETNLCFMNTHLPPKASDMKAQTLTRATTCGYNTDSAGWIVDWLIRLPDTLLRTQRKVTTRVSVSCPRTLRHADGEDWRLNHQLSGWRTTTPPLSHRCPRVYHLMSSPFNEFMFSFQLLFVLWNTQR